MTNTYNTDTLYAALKVMKQVRETRSTEFHKMRDLEKAEYYANGGQDEFTPDNGTYSPVLQSMFAELHATTLAIRTIKEAIQDIEAGDL